MNTILIRSVKGNSENLYGHRTTSDSWAIPESSISRWQDSFLWLHYNAFRLISISTVLLRIDQEGRAIRQSPSASESLDDLSRRLHFVACFGIWDRCMQFWFNHSRRDFIKTQFTRDLLMCPPFAIQCVWTTVYGVFSLVSDAGAAISDWRIQFLFDQVKVKAITLCMCRRSFLSQFISGWQDRFLYHRLICSSFSRWLSWIGIQLLAQVLFLDAVLTADNNFTTKSGAACSNGLVTISAMHAWRIWRACTSPLFIIILHHFCIQTLIYSSLELVQLWHWTTAACRGVVRLQGYLVPSQFPGFLEMHPLRGVNLLSLHGSLTSLPIPGTLLMLIL
jgi:hypothetical protein